MGWDFLGYVLVGFAAQLVDGAIGMAYGVVSTSVLLGLGVTPVVASASVHAAEVFTTGISGLSHLHFRNINRQLFLRLAIPGGLGAATGAWCLTVLPGEAIRPYIAGYLLVMGLVILAKAFRKLPPEPPKTDRLVPPLGFFGGFADAVGGGGWGPIVASTLLARGSAPRYVIGSVNLAEFFVTVAASVTFVGAIGFAFTEIVLGILIGGVVAAPLGAWLAGRLPARLMMSVVACVIIALSANTLLRAAF